MRKPSMPLIAAFTAAASSLLVAGPADAHRVDQRTTYTVTALPALGGTSSIGNSITGSGLVAGESNLPGDTTMNAVLWHSGRPRSLGTLGGPNSAIVWPGTNNSGSVVGITETAAMNPYQEPWSCSAFFFPNAPTGHDCVGFVYSGGAMRALPTLGGPDGFATEINDTGQAVGWAENTTHDPTCDGGQVFQFRAAEWNTGAGTIRELDPAAGDSTSAATAINDSGLVAGISGDCGDAVGSVSARHALLWVAGLPHELQLLQQGSSWNTPVAINQSGEIAGFAHTTSGNPGDADLVAVIWRPNGRVQNLGTLPGDAVSEALGINDLGQVVGISCTAGFAICHAVIWQDEKISQLTAPGYSGQLTDAQDINDAGVITGQATDAAGHSVAFKAVPTR